ncbi:hypothetical protein PTKIN_Ptkin01aG0294100 [Pterospermum kingtungense]
MERKASMCIILAFLGALSFATGLGAEFTRTKASDVKLVYGECSYPASPETGLGLTSATTLLIAKIIISFATGRRCCCRRTSQTGNSIGAKAIIFFLLSWITFAIAFIFLLTGSLVNNRHGKYKDGNYYCYVVKPGIFTKGAVFAVASVILGIIYYLTSTSTKKTTNSSGNAPDPNNQGGIQMGQP